MELVGINEGSTATIRHGITSDLPVAPATVVFAGEFRGSSDLTTLRRFPSLSPRRGGMTRP